MRNHMLVTPETVTVVSVWAHAVVVEEIDPIDDSKRYPALNVQCGEEVKRASLGDYIIKHGDGTYDVLGPMAYLAHIKEEQWP